MWGAGGQQEPLKPGTAGVTGVTQEGTAQAGPQCAPFIERLPHGGPRVGVGGPGAESTCRALHCQADPIQPLKPCKRHQLADRDPDKQVDAVLPLAAAVGPGVSPASSGQVLCSWLSNSPNYEEITKWYLGWKSMFSDQVLAHPSVKDKFNEALDIMNRAVSSNVGEWGPRTESEFTPGAPGRRLVSAPPRSYLAHSCPPSPAAERSAVPERGSREPGPPRHRAGGSSVRPPGGSWVAPLTLRSYPSSLL